MDNLSAFHEGGHCVVSLLLGEMPENVSIRAEGDSLGHTSYLPVEATAIARAAMNARTKADRERVETFLLATAAGPAAQALKMRGTPVNFLDQGSWETFGGGQDYRQFELVREKAGSRFRIDRDQIVSEAFNFLDKPRVWAAVKRVAAELIRFKELTYDDLKLIIY